jgi:hypothetical protein
MQITSEELSSPLRKKLKSLQDSKLLRIRKGGKDLESASISDIKFLENGITEGDFGEGFNYQAEGSCQLTLPCIDGNCTRTYPVIFQCLLSVRFGEDGKIEEVVEIKDNTIKIVR